MKKEDAIKIIIKAAEEYHNNLENKNLFFISGQPDKPNFVETVFLPRHFLHLTGAKVNNSLTSSYFYKQCLNKRLTINYFSMASDGTTEMKLKVISPLMNIHKTAKMIGNYNQSGISLSTDKLVGGVTGCLGLVASNNNLYHPNTLLNKDIRQITHAPQDRILAILRKPITQANYTELCYAAKGVQLDKIKLSSDFTEKIDIPQFHLEKNQQQNQPPIPQTLGSDSPAPPDYQAAAQQKPYFKDLAKKAQQKVNLHNARTEKEGQENGRHKILGDQRSGRGEVRNTQQVVLPLQNAGNHGDIHRGSAESVKQDGHQVSAFKQPGKMQNVKTQSHSPHNSRKKKFGKMSFTDDKKVL